MRTVDPAKVERIIEAAMQLFAELPYHEVRMDDIAARAKVAKGTLYLHYKDKEDLYIGLMVAGLRLLIARIEKSLTADMIPEEKLLVITRETIEHFTRNSFFLDMMQRVEVLRVGAKSACLEETKTGFAALLSRVLREIAPRDRSTAAQTQVEALAFSGMMKEILHSLPRPWPDDLPERITRLFLHGVGAKSVDGARPRQHAALARGALPGRKPAAPKSRA